MDLRRPPSFELRWQSQPTVCVPVGSHPREERACAQSGNRRFKLERVAGIAGGIVVGGSREHRDAGLGEQILQFHHAAGMRANARVSRTLTGPVVRCSHFIVDAATVADGVVNHDTLPNASSQLLAQCGPGAARRI